eukprot:Sspe_Gene.7100::Locus_2398_Transcript_1_1_Confidence_1.000_Length_755::g.7100::m.7100
MVGVADVLQPGETITKADSLVSTVSDLMYLKVPRHAALTSKRVSRLAADVMAADVFSSGTTLPRDLRVQDLRLVAREGGYYVLSGSRGKTIEVRGSCPVKAAKGMFEAAPIDLPPSQFKVVGLSEANIADGPNKIQKAMLLLCSCLDQVRRRKEKDRDEAVRALHRAEVALARVETLLMPCRERVMLAFVHKYRLAALPHDVVATAIASYLEPGVVPRNLLIARGLARKRVASAEDLIRQ